MVPNLNKPQIDWDIARRVLIIENVITPELCDEVIELDKDQVQPAVNKYSDLFGISFQSCLLPLDHKIHSILQPVWAKAIEHFKFNINFVEPYEFKSIHSKISLAST